MWKSQQPQMMKYESMYIYIHLHGVFTTDERCLTRIGKESTKQSNKIHTGKHQGHIIWDNAVHARFQYYSWSINKTKKLVNGF